MEVQVMGIGLMALIGLVLVAAVVIGIVVAVVLVASNSGRERDQ